MFTAKVETEWAWSGFVVGSTAEIAEFVAALRHEFLSALSGLSCGDCAALVADGVSATCSCGARTWVPSISGDPFWMVEALMDLLDLPSGWSPDDACTHVAVRVASVDVSDLGHAPCAELCRSVSSASLVEHLRTLTSGVEFVVFDDHQVAARLLPSACFTPDPALEEVCASVASLGFAPEIGCDFEWVDGTQVWAASCIWTRGLHLVPEDGSSLLVGEGPVPERFLFTLGLDGSVAVMVLGDPFEPPEFEELEAEFGSIDEDVFWGAVDASSEVFSERSGGWSALPRFSDGDVTCSLAWGPAVAAGGIIEAVCGAEATRAATVASAEVVFFDCLSSAGV